MGFSDVLSMVRLYQTEYCSCAVKNEFFGVFEKLAEKYALLMNCLGIW